MNEDLIVLDPTSEVSPIIRDRLARPASLAGLRIGLLDINKSRGDKFLDRIEELLSERGNTVNRYKKERFSILAPVDLQQQIGAECDIVIEALAD
jgi:3-hydroxyacyl-CoA dehydrogenase